MVCEISAQLHVTSHFAGCQGRRIGGNGGFSGKFMTDEQLDVIDEHDRVIAKARKGVAHARGLRHRVGAVLLQRGDGKYLIPTASAVKVEAGRLYHSAAGHVLSGESYEESALRELLEETGMKGDAIEYLGAFWFEESYAQRVEKERFQVYRVRYRPDMGPVKLNEEQVNEKWLGEEDLKALYVDRPETLSGPLRMTCRYLLGFES
jgi:8-oxo-dGTP pyrophosphatase MutT (NUDIX family)